MRVKATSGKLYAWSAVGTLAQPILLPIADDLKRTQRLIQNNHPSNTAVPGLKAQ